MTEKPYSNLYKEEPEEPYIWFWEDEPPLVILRNGGCVLECFSEKEAVDLFLKWFRPRKKEFDAACS